MENAQVQAEESGEIMTMMVNDGHKGGSTAGQGVTHNWGFNAMIPDVATSISPQ